MEARVTSVDDFADVTDQRPAILPCNEKLRSLSDFGGDGSSLVGPMAGRCWKQENSEKSSPVLAAVSGLGKSSGLTST